MDGIGAAVAALGGLLLLAAVLRAGSAAARAAAPRLRSLAAAATSGSRALGLRGLLAAAVGTTTAGLAAPTSAAVTVAPHSGARPSTAAPTAAPAPVADADADADYVVRPGDSLWAIAARHLGPGASDAAIAAAWPRWYRANRAVIGSDPSLLLVGTHLAVPHGRRTGTSASWHPAPAPSGPDRTALSLDPDRR